MSACSCSRVSGSRHKFSAIPVYRVLFFCFPTKISPNAQDLFILPIYFRFHTIAKCYVSWVNRFIELERDMRLSWPITDLGFVFFL